MVTRVEEFRSSERDYDWLGRGIYFWEYGPKQALKFAKIRQRQYMEKKDKTAEDLRRATEPLAVVACMIRLGFCLDLTDPDKVEDLGRIFDSYTESMEQAGAPLPKNSRKYRRLDCAVFEYAWQGTQRVRAVFDVGHRPRDLRPDRRRSADLARKLDFSGHPHPTLRAQSRERPGGLASSSDQSGGGRYKPRSVTNCRCRPRGRESAGR